MADKRISFVYQKKGKAVTGGQIYDDNFIRVTGNIPGVKADLVLAPKVNSKIQKILAPLRNLTLASELKDRDLVVFNSSNFGYFLPLNLILRARGVKTAVIHHHFLAREQKNLKKAIYTLLENAFLRQCGSVVTPSPYISHEIEKECGRKPELCLIPFERPANADKASPWEGNLLFIGTIEPRKGLVYLMEALAILKKKGVAPVLHVAGKCVDASYMEKIKGMVEADGLNVRFHGFVSDEELENLKLEADIFVFPSLLEGYGMALNEVMAYGIPVICFDNSAMPYSVRSGENGLLVPTGSAAGLADAIGLLLADRGKREKLGEGAREYAGKLADQNSFEQRVREIIRGLTEAAGNKRGNIEK